MSQALMEPVVDHRCDCGRDDDHCEITLRDSEECCGKPAIASVIVSCRGDHPEGLPICAKHLDDGFHEDLECYACEPPAPAYVIAVLAR